MSVSLDHFALFGLAPRFAVDLDALEAAYKRVQAQVHPDRFAAGSAAERRVAMQWATQANEAYRALRDDARRAAYLCERAGVPIDAESNTAMPTDFLMQQLEWREALDEARASGQGDAAVRAQVDAARGATIEQLAAALDTAQDAPRAAALVRQLMFIDKFRTDALAVDESAARDAVGG
ncbi:MAG: Fe-S protein assembly co-chaperone HscB [Burkholderiaceae bacterium]|nr:Fe-S protein assembly co-chaperone HscB [Burkholderiaceae bacterium]